MQKATITKNAHDGKIASHRKEQHFSQEFALLVTYKAARIPADYKREGENMSAVVRARIYSVPNRTWGAVFHACIWINDKARGEREAVHISGGGVASGYGYHKPSAALGSAIADAGIQLKESINGVGDDAMRGALLAIGKALGYKPSQMHIHNAHA